MATAVVLGGHLDVVMVPAAVRVVILDAQVREVDLVIEVREVVFVRPLSDFLLCPIGVSVVVRAVAIPLVEPGLVLTLELVVEHDAVNPRATLGQGAPPHVRKRDRPGGHPHRCSGE